MNTIPMNDKWNREFQDAVFDEAIQKYAKAIDSFLKQGLSQRAIGRMIVWCTDRDRMILARILSKIVGIDLEIEKSPSSLVSENWRLIYAGKCISKASYNVHMHISI